MAMVRILMSLATIAVVFESIMAKNHTVGAPNGRWNENTDLTTWAASQTFIIGDSLIFMYTPNHDVLEVTKGDYDSCQTTNAISTNGGGMTIIPLSSTGKRYFICGTSGHCASGMKLEVNTLATVPPPASSPPVNSPVPSPTPKNAPKISPAANSPSTTTVEVPTLPPSGGFVPTSSPPSPSTPSSAEKISVVATSIVGFGVVTMMLFFM